MPAAIQTRGIGKRYRLGETGPGSSIRDAMTGWVRRRGLPREEIWALRDVSLDIGVGEAVGLVGRNGCGKTTLLKVLTRITEPTEGTARTRGRVGALLEVGTGFHPDLTGRENIFLEGSVLGMSKADVRRRFDEIVEFSGVQRFLDTPLKRYSSGMYLRLAFAVAAFMEPDILVVDEVLAVGDAEFQQRCLGRMEDLSSSGRTIIFVSHDLGALARICGRAVWLDDGRVRGVGEPRQIIDDYLDLHVPRAAAVEIPAVTGSPVQLRSVAVTDASGAPVSGAARDEGLWIRMEIATTETQPYLDLGVWLVNARDVRVIDDRWSDDRAAPGLRIDAGGTTARVAVPPVLPPGEYRVGVWIASQEQEFIRQEYLRVQIRPRPDDREEQITRDRAVQTPLRWVVEPGGAA